MGTPTADAFSMPGAISVTRIANVLWFVGLSGLLGLVLVTEISSPPTVLTGWRIAILFVGFAIFAGSVRAVTGETISPIYYLLFLATGLVLVVLLYAYRAHSFAIGSPTAIDLLIVYGVLAAFVLVYPHASSFSRVQWILIGCFGIVIGLLFFHTTTLPPHQSAPTWPLWASVVAAVSLLVIPRLVPERIFLWSIAILVAIAALAGLRTLIVDEFTIFLFETSRTSPDFPFTQTQYDWWRGTSSVFRGSNPFGLISFAGLVAATILARRAFQANQTVATGVAGGLAILNGTGLLISSSDASWIAAGSALAVYGIAVLADRQMVVPTIAIGSPAAAIAVAGVYFGLLPIDHGGRFDRWRSGIRAFRASPSILGHGHVSTADFTADYLEYMSPRDPHNSYLSILIRTGIVGATAYVALLIGGIAHALSRIRTVNVGMLAFAIGWAVHHLFEAYTIIQWTAPAVLSSLVFGYLLFGQPQRMRFNGFDRLRNKH